METNPSKMNEKTADLSPTEWFEKFRSISKEELELSTKPPHSAVLISIDDYNNENEYEKKLKAESDLRMIRMAPLFVSQPRLEKICKDRGNQFLSSCFTRYTFNSKRNDSVNEIREKANDLEYLLNLCGSNLTCLNVKQYPTSQIMPIINANCSNLESLYARFKEIMSQDFENCFSNMSQLKYLTIHWECENSTLLMTLVKSLEQIGGTLKSLEFACTLEINKIFLPDPLASVLPRLTALNRLVISNVELSQLLLQSIGEIKNLTDLMLMSSRSKNHPILDTRINMYPIGYLKNLEKLYILSDYGVRDEFLINLCNNAKRLRILNITGTNISDIGMRAINELEQLEEFDLGLIDCDPLLGKNQFITDESIQCLFNQKLIILNIANCINITDKGVFKVVENLPNLKCLHIQNTKVTLRAVEKIRESTKHCQKPLMVYANIKIW
ncbi:uncharacterized protein LOC122849735 [Aphidius gifuensis]|uniref:uncharacterized protein LOC122849735 n=1 Tax=Aphidius gifuensis TaxID=684658 RepID=UPI001CDD381D|nr:uncharacterized protein LOC122849735 [Aphidius gifuensis]XP_044004463.1 uncharacterized protein LOC122849735 [Aphidius gifuensis]XP_044004464.1 uncharacterized protein LOC122849735 [Aphidius gifuensis]